MTNPRKMMMGAAGVAGGEVTTEGSLYSTGDNQFGQLGSGDTTRRRTFARVGSVATWKELSCDEWSSAAIRTDGTLWTWGRNNYGGLGQGSTTNLTAPTQVGSLTNWSKVKNLTGGFIALKTDGTIWVCGSNAQGQLGQGDVINRSSPVQVGSGTDYASVGGFTSLMAIKTNGTAWTWGSGASGEHGQGNVLNISSPTQLGSLTNWVRTAIGSGPSNHQVAVKTDGTIWGWGSNYAGRAIPNGTETPQSSPVQIGSLTTWSQGREKSSAGNAFHLWIKTDGTLWAWGNNPQGQLGDGTKTTRTTPVQIGAKTDWAEVACGVSSAQAINENGELWAWGDNSGNYYGLGLGDAVDRSSPVQVGSENTWGQSAMGYGHSIGFHTA